MKHVWKGALAIVLIVVGITAGAAPAGISAYRTWTSLSGKFTTTARLIDCTDQAVVLMRRDPWQTAKIPINKLSEADERFARETKANVIIGKVIGVTDGDTIEVRADDENHKVRLDGIDAPEKGQDYSEKAHQALVDMLYGNGVRVRWAEKDRYGRILGRVIARNKWVNFELVHDGWAWQHKEYSDDADLALAEEQAREAKRGLWADPNMPMPPWEYRRRNQLTRPATLREPTITYGRFGGDAKAQPLGHWLNTSSSVRHNRSCKYYQNTKQGRACSASEGKACGICGG